MNELATLNCVNLRCARVREHEHLLMATSTHAAHHVIGRTIHRRTMLPKTCRRYATFLDSRLADTAGRQSEDLADTAES